MTGMAAYLRRSIAWLNWIDSHHADATVRWNSAALGTWKDLSPRWKLDGSRICFQLLCPERPLVFWITSISPASWGAKMALWGRCGPAQQLRIIWEHAEVMDKPACSMLKAASAWARSQWPGCIILSAAQAADRTHTLSGDYARIRVKHGADDHLLLACSTEGDDEQAHAILGQALLWMALLRNQGKLVRVPIVHMLVPAGRSAVLVHRCGLINPQRARIQVWEFEETPSGPLQARQPATPAVPVEDRDFRWPVLGPFRWSPLLARVLDLAPDAIQRYPRFQDYDSLRLLGLEFARVLGPDRDRICYGVGSQNTELTDDNFEDLHSLVSEILYYRRADGPATDHPYYRLQAERWLECLLLSDIAFLFPELVPGSVYPQIPVYLGKVPGRVDILGADREGNLVVMELKVAEDPDMPLQSLDYWGRVIGHNFNGDFERRGYFNGIRLSRARPKIYLVAPIFTFHDSLERVLRCLDPGLEVTKVAINEDWRCGVKILRRVNVRCSEMD